MAKEWFSGLLVCVVLLDLDGATERQRSVVLAQASDFDDAFKRFVDIGRSRESRYVGGAGQQVRWAFERVETIDWLGTTIPDGREVYSESWDIDPNKFAFDHAFTPEQSRWGQSGV